MLKRCLVLHSLAQIQKIKYQNFKITTEGLDEFGMFSSFVNRSMWRAPNDETISGTFTRNLIECAKEKNYMTMQDNFLLKCNSVKAVLNLPSVQPLMNNQIEAC